MGGTPTKGPPVLLTPMVMAMSAIVRGRPVKAASLYMRAVALTSLLYSSKELIISMAPLPSSCCALLLLFLAAAGCTGCSKTKAAAE